MSTSVPKHEEARHDEAKAEQQNYEQPPELNDEDEAILDSIWAKIGKEQAAERAGKASGSS